MSAHRTPYLVPEPMIEAVEIQNFRCFRSLKMTGLGRLNIVVGDSGAGKTSLLEAIFLALCSNPQGALNLRAHRGGEHLALSGSVDAMISELYGDLFFDFDMSKELRVTLKGMGPEARTLVVHKGRGDILIPKGADSTAKAEVLSPLTFEWTDEHGSKRRGDTRISPQGIALQGTGEMLPQFFYFSAQSAVNSIETADRFSQLRNSGQDKKFVRLFTSVYDWVKDVSVESKSGAPIVTAALKGARGRIPINLVSGSVSRAFGLFTAIASRENGVVLIDEIENGLFHERQTLFCKTLIQFARQYKCQLFITTHSQEWLRHFVEASDGKIDDVVFWRAERGKKEPELLRFSGDHLRAAIEYKTEVRG